MKDWDFFQREIEDVVCNRCSFFISSDISCENCKNSGDIASIRMLIEDMKNNKILIED